MARLFSLFACALALIPLSARAVEFTYTLAGSTAIIADDNAVKFLSVSPVGELVIADDGSITGQGVLIFSYMSPCKWRAPVPTDEYNCITLSVDDGAFLIEGKVTEWVNRHDDDNPLKDGIFAFAEPRASERPDLAPFRISLTLRQTKATAENLVVWGLSGGNVEDHTTGASAIGMYVSGLFDQPFEIIALPQQYRFAVPVPPNLHSYSGSFSGGTPVAAGGVIGLSATPRSALPWKTPEDVYGAYWSLPAESQSFTPEDLKNMQITQQDSRADAAQDILDSMNELQENGRIPLSVWMQMGAAFEGSAPADPGPDLDPAVQAALNQLDGG